MTNQRLFSLDVFRGMTIFFMIVVNTPGSWSYVYTPLLHAKWDGCTPTDLVFPFFMFIVGVSMSISFQKYTDDIKKRWISKAITRGLKIIIIGLLLNWFPFFTKDLSELRIYGVLQRIGLSFLVAGVIIYFVRIKYLWYFIAALLFGYWAILISNAGDNLSLEGNLVRIWDIYLLGENHIYKGYGIPFDPEGLLSTIPSIGTVLIGFLVGEKIRITPDMIKKVNMLLIYGLVFTVLGLIWSFLGFPINKPLWSSSYVLFTAGLAMILLGLLIWIIDIKGFHRWTYVFNAFGKNPLVTYILSGLLVKTALLIKLDGMNLYQWLYLNIFQIAFGNYFGSLMFALSVVMTIWLIAWWMDRRGIIIKV